MKQRLRLLIVENSDADRALLLHALDSQGYAVVSLAVATAIELRAALEEEQWDLIICGQPIADFPAAAALAIAKEVRPLLPFIIVSSETDLNLAVALIKLGAQDYVQKSELVRLGAVIDRELRTAEWRRRQKVTEGKLYETQELFRAIVENVGDLVAVLDTEGRRVYNSPSYRPLFREKDIRQGSSSFMEIHPDDRERIKAVFRKTVETGIGECSEFRFVLRDGSIRFMESDGRAIRDAEGKVSKVVVVSRDITEQKRLEADLREMAATDMLTGLPNRRHFLGQLEQEKARVSRAEEKCAAVLMIDIDHFKVVNDSFGHAAGDHVLRHLATLMKEDLRKIDTLGRLGGEEFAVILPGADRAAAEIFAERLRKQVAETPAVLDKWTIPVTISIGVTEIKPGDDSADDALTRADRALYRAKECGRNRVTVEV
ncbi:MAG: diguanylate cyclase [Burkholderiales bacterium]|jgi:diguanylate cyclase (GGDEF)-like protein/PAS domain S-box-containing protein|nr:diguanylate cyclase [Burkholderiales bacterium]